MKAKPPDHAPGKSHDEATILTQDTRVRQPALDGLRGFAALTVAAMHLTLSFGLLPYSTLGYTGVTVFFVLSGYLIGGIWIGHEGRRVSYSQFVRRRVARLVPVAAALTLIGTPALALFGGASIIAAIRDGALALLQLTAVTSTLGVDAHPFFEPTWSLTVEWTFYLAFPLGFILIRQRVPSEHIAKVLAAIAVGLYLIGLPLTFEAFYLLPVANLGVMFAGAALAASHAKRSERPTSDRARTVMAMTTLAILAVAPGYSMSWSWKLAVMPAAALAAIAVIQGVQAQDRAAAVLAWPPLSALGRGAYSLYLWHLPVMWLVWFNSPGMNMWLQSAIAIACVATVSSLSYRLLECPVLRRSKGHTDLLPATQIPEGSQAPPHGDVRLETRPTRSSQDHRGHNDRQTADSSSIGPGRQGPVPGLDVTSAGSL